MSGAEFEQFYLSVHGRRPFPWQRRLAERVVSEGWPGTISVPTGCGKTSVIDVAVFALAMQAGQADRTAPMRIFFVVDRRLVVDDVFEHAKEVVDALAEGRPAWIADRLRSFGNQRPLEAAVMRGGMYRSDTWADAPNQPLVCVSTVDQVGSRLLFRGYGISESRRPVHAGLVGNDSLIVVDEAHLSRPFLDTMEAVRRYQSEGWREAPARALQFVQMSATLGAGFTLGEEDMQSSQLRPRLEAKKIAELYDTGALPRSAAEEARRLAGPGKVVGVVLNTVRAARSVFEELRSHGEAILLTGRSRPFERDEVLREYKPRIEAKRQSEGPGLFVVATQTVEVGADIDFDGLVTQSAPISSLRQRFGRLDRLGRRGSSQAAILRARGKEPDLVYGATELESWEWLKQQPQPVDFGVLRMANPPEHLNGKPASAPLMFPAHVETWAQTNPTPAADPDVAPFLHGPDSKQAADVQIVWRADLSEDDNEWAAILSEASPLATEALALPYWTVKDWLSRRPGADVADIEGAGKAEVEGREAEPRVFLIWEGPDKPRRKELRPGDTIVVRSREGGCDRFGWNPDSQSAVRDIGDECANQRAEAGGGKHRRRIHPMVLFPGAGQSEMSTQLAELLDDAAVDEDRLPAVRTFVMQHVDGADRWNWGSARAYGAGTAVLLEWRALEKRRTSESDDSDEGEGDRSSLTRGRTLTEHTAGVVEKAALFSRGCGLNGAAGAAVRRAAELHDLGKQDGRFQLMLGNTKLEPLAKSGRRSGRRGEYPKGARHEFASVRIAEAGANWPEDCDRELALHLIGTHHGYGRPFPPVWSGDGYEIRAAVDGRQVVVRDVERVARIDSGWPERYAALTRKYGCWGLAYMEAILRRADCVCSREEEEKGL